MKAFFKPILLITLFISSNFITASSCDRACSKKTQFFQHDIQLQLADGFGLLVPDTEFWVTLDIIKQGPLVTVQLPVINFQTLNDPFEFGAPAGGYLYTVDGFLPAELRPIDLVPRSIVAASNNGLSPAFSFIQDPATLPVPPAGYIVQVTNAGALQVQCAGTFGNLIAPGPQILMPCSIEYIVKPKKKLCENIVLSNGATNITQFTDNPCDLPLATANATNNFRDSHVNDAFDGVVAWAWADNSTQTDKANGVLNTFVCVGKTDAQGKLVVKTPVQLTDLPACTQTWCSGVAIVRDGPHKGNIVVSYGLFDYTQRDLTNRGRVNLCSCRAVSTDGGNTWENAPLTYNSFYGSIAGNVLTVTNVVYGSLTSGQEIYTYTATLPDPGILAGTTILTQLTGTPGGVGTYQVSGPAQNTGPNYTVALPQGVLVPVQPSNSRGGGDQRGVSADKFGNIWYGTTIAFPEGFSGPYTNQPIFTISTDGGITFETTPVYSVPLPDPVPPITFLYDFPQYCFGGRGDGSDDYGLWFTVAFHENDIDVTPIVGFIPIYGAGLDNIGTGTLVNLTGFVNVQNGPSITAAADGRVWMQSYDLYPATAICPFINLFKSPGDIDANYAGAWNLAMVNANPLFGTQTLISQPFNLGYFNSIQCNIYDEKREALYSLIVNTFPDASQNMRLYFIISRDNGMTWSDPIDISSTDFANRGFQSMALDTVTGDLVFGWYDGRNDPSYESVEYMAAIIPAKKLDKLVSSIPLSNPTFSVPPATTPPALKSAFNGAPVDQARVAAIKERFKHKRNELF